MAGYGFHTPSGEAPFGDPVFAKWILLARLGYKQWSSLVRIASLPFCFASLEPFVATRLSPWLMVRRSGFTGFFARMQSKN
jgi:hypothetical protein